MAKHKKHKWTKAQRDAASLRMKQRYAQKRADKAEVVLMPHLPKPVGIVSRINQIEDNVRGLLDEVLALVEVIQRS